MGGGAVWLVRPPRIPHSLVAATLLTAVEPKDMKASRPILTVYWERQWLVWGHSDNWSHPVSSLLVRALSTASHSPWRWGGQSLEASSAGWSRTRDQGGREPCWQPHQPWRSCAWERGRQKGSALLSSHGKLPHEDEPQRLESRRKHTRLSSRKRFCWKYCGPWGGILEVDSICPDLCFSMIQAGKCPKGIITVGFSCL